MPRRASNRVLRLFALTALVVQLGASFGHVHLDAGRDRVAASAQYAGSGRDHRPLPAHDEDESDCSICQVMSLLVSAVVPPPPAIAHPAVCRVRSDRPRVVQIVVSKSAQNFQARAPPAGDASDAA